jgi:dTDP-glucose 4,6-dehydratase
MNHNFEKSILITGCAGFIGSHATDYFLSMGHNVVGVDCLTYAGNMKNLDFSSKFDSFKFVKEDICNTESILEICLKNNVEWIVNFAAESHVDNSIKSCSSFVHSNIEGVMSLLDVCKSASCKMFHISTDEVYGTIDSGSFCEQDKLDPRNPYSATKAAAEHLVNSYYHTHGVNFKMVRMSNNFGPRQNSEKFLPTVIRSLMSGKKIPVYGDGLNVRDWLYVKDACQIIYRILEVGESNTVYNVTHNNEMTNLDLVESVTEVLGLKLIESIEFVKDRPGHDFRYSIDNSRLLETGISPPVKFKTALRETIESWRDK